MEPGAINMQQEQPDIWSQLAAETGPYGGGGESVLGYTGCTSEIGPGEHREGWLTEQALTFWTMVSTVSARSSSTSRSTSHMPASTYRTATRSCMTSPTFRTDRTRRGRLSRTAMLNLGRQLSRSGNSGHRMSAGRLPCATSRSAHTLMISLAACSTTRIAGEVGELADHLRLGSRRDVGRPSSSLQQVLSLRRQRARTAHPGRFSHS